MVLHYELDGIRFELEVLSSELCQQSIHYYFILNKFLHAGIGFGGRTYPSDQIRKAFKAIIIYHYLKLNVILVS